MPKTKNKPLNKKRHGLHHSHGKHYRHVYWPYIPSILLIVASLLLSGLRLPLVQKDVLAYATEMSSSSLLSATNTHRSNAGKASLKINSKLSSAAQAKANDMVTRDYWSHNTPDGQEPWVFIDQAGYSYTKAGENLAYGFMSSSETVSGWMNSPAHKANMLDTAFTEVGFGYKNSSNFQQQGEQTVVVAMYGQPQTLGVAATEPESEPAQPAPAPSKKSQQTKQPVATQPDTSAEPSETDEPSSAANEKPTTTDQAVTNLTPEYEVTKIEALTIGKAPWAALSISLVASAALCALLINHGLKLRKLLQGGERFLLHHPVLDATMVSLVIFVLTLSQRIGTIL